MSLTPITHYRQVYAGAAAPISSGFMPEDPTDAAVFVLFAPAMPPAQYVWDVDGQAWVAMPNNALNWSRVEAFGWYGMHNDTRRQARPAHTLIDQTCIFFPAFSAHGPSSSPLPFEIVEMVSGNVLATGTLPAGSIYEDAAGVALVDPLNAPLDSFTVAPGQQLQFAARPTGGHAAAPADGFGFSVAGYIAF